ncbi:hypothetical protein GCM10012285_15960 [Streptomyces kronopolitis]|uniref:Secreted protein n=1 Tax=Streptomyces kronopolitis TaxID=1612435 RepID=A0ABQ2J3B0_9ACTN|nr:hypothetical protein [Streptomyces kronopolitis]GGN39165.1 hypothetical protein GCM10012285_15960 [Streptomyces kronopolitis]
MQRAQKLRLTGLAGLAVLAIVVPLGAATAGPAHRVTPGAQLGAAAKAENSSSAETGNAAESGADPDRAPALRTDSGTGHRPGPGPDRFPGRTARCGPELTVPQGIEAQTCVLSRAGRTRARTYYRNRTGRPLRAALTLLRPDGGAVQVNCAVPAAGAPGMCETPAGPTVHAGGLRYAAVAEVSDAAGERLLLRSGSNSPLRSGGSAR